MQPGAGRRVPKAHHSKTRTGCQQCRQRRVKCSEEKPICSKCTRLALPCVYGYESKATKKRPQATPATRRDEDDLLNSMSHCSLPSEGRRNPDLEWFYMYVSETAPSIAVEQQGKDLWGPASCRAALTSNSVLYSICLIASIHHAHKNGALDLESDPVAMAYLGMALEEHRKDVSQLSVENIDNACLSSNMFRIFDLIKLQYRSLVPYTPPVAWMSMTSAMRGMFARASTLTADKPDSIARLMIEAVGSLLLEQDELTNIDELVHLLPPDADPTLTDEALEAYRVTVNIVGGIWKACRTRRSSRELRIRLITFPIFLGDSFIRLTSQRQPRALVILAHYFAGLSIMRSYWYVGDAGSRELDAIEREVPAEWKSLLREPLALRDEIVSSQAVP